MLTVKSQNLYQNIEHLRNIGDHVFFEYHCNESHNSQHAKWWYHSHQTVTIVGIPQSDGLSVPSWRERMEGGTPIMYRVRWSDGFEGDVFEDELLDNESEYERPNPPNNMQKG